MVNVTYVSGNASLLDRIAPLWQELNKQHLSLSPNFKSYYTNLTFEERKRAILEAALDGEVRVDLALNAQNETVGYCVTLLDRFLMGSVESIFVAPQYRRQGIGRALMEKALAWLTEKGAKKKIVSVAIGNEQACGFYEGFGFLPRRTVLEQKQQ